MSHWYEPWHHFWMRKGTATSGNNGGDGRKFRHMQATIRLKVNSHCTCHDASRYIAERRVASRHMLFLQFTLVKRCLIFLVTMASQQQDMLLALALQTQVIALIVLQKQRKSDGFRF